MGIFYLCTPQAPNADIIQTSVYRGIWASTPGNTKELTGTLGCAQEDPHNFSETSVIALEIKLFL